jgi:hypothetical protein
MNDMGKEYTKYLFVVAIDIRRFTNVSALGIFKTRIRTRPQSVVEEVPELLKINFYHDLFVGVVDITEDTAESPMAWGDGSVRSLMGKIFKSLNVEGDEDFSYLTWVLVPLSELTSLDTADAVLKIMGAAGGIGGRAGAGG